MLCCVDRDVDLGSGDIVLDGDQLPQGTQPLPISADVCCGQTAGWIKMPLGTAVGLGPRDIELDGDPAPLTNWHSSPPLFGYVYCGQMVAHVSYC